MKLNILSEFYILFDPSEFRGLKYTYYVSLLSLILTLYFFNPAALTNPDVLFNVLAYESQPTAIALALSIIGAIILLIFQKLHFNQQTVKESELLNTAIMAVIAFLSIYFGVMLLISLLDYVLPIVKITGKLATYSKLLFVVVFLWFLKNYHERLDYMIT